MRPHFALYALALAAQCAVGCAPGWNDPPAPLPGHPCNELEVECPTQHGCCPEGQTCGGEPASVGCPALSCCPVGPGFMGPRAVDAGPTPGARPMRVVCP